MDRETERRQSQLAFVASNQEILLGDPAQLPLSVAQLQSLDADADCVERVFDGGLTARVYQLNIDGRLWNLKRKRKTSLVQNVDGQTSFLNELQRRQELMALKADPATAQQFRYVVDTHYASYQQGIMLSPWISGQLINSYNERNLQQLLQTLVAFELNGMLEWDASPGNIIDDGERITLFDFGYCYRFDPLTEFNSNGTALPQFHAIERFETRSLSGHLLRLENRGQAPEALALFKLTKQLAVELYQYKLAELKRRGANSTVCCWLEGIIKCWQTALASQAQLEDRYLLDMYRSHLLDVVDDVSGKSCTATTLQRIDRLEQMLSQQADTLERLQGLDLFAEGNTRQQIAEQLVAYRQQATQYQL